MSGRWLNSRAITMANFIRRVFKGFRATPLKQPQELPEPPVGATLLNEDYFLRNPGPVVYLMQHGERPEYKIGQTKDVSTRRNRVGLLMPDPVHLIHCIYTNDPRWLEAFWHSHFASKRKIGSGKRRASEWFDLTETDIQLFKQHHEWNNPALGSRSQPSLFSGGLEQKPEHPSAEPKKTAHQATTDQPTPRASAASSTPALSSRAKAQAVGRVAAYFDQKIAAHPNRAAKAFFN